MKGKTRTISVTAAIAALTIATGLAGCGATSPTEAPSTIYPESSPTAGPAAGKAYLNGVKGVLSSVRTTVAALPDAVQGLSRKPDDTWSTAAADLQGVSAQLGDEATALEALQPPETLRPIHDAVLVGIEGAQTAVDKLAAALDKGVETSETTRTRVQSTVDSVESLLKGLSGQLSSALGGLVE